MFRSIFRPYGTLWTVLNHITDVLALSLIWCLCSLPIVTVGAATTALYDAVVRGVRYSQPGTYRRFFRTFRAELVTATAATLLWGAILVFCSYVLALLNDYTAENTSAAIMAGAYRVLTLLPISCACWSAAILSRFSYRFRGLIPISVRIIPAHLLTSLAVSALTWVTVYYCTSYPLALTFAPALLMLCWSLPLEPVFRKYGGDIRQEELPEEEAEEPESED